MIKLIANMGITALCSGVVVAWSMYFLVILAMMCCISKYVDRWQMAIALATMAFFPGSIYYCAVFPVSLYLVFVSSFFIFVQKKQWVIASLLGAGSAFTYSTGFLLSGVLFVAILCDPSPGKTFLRSVQENVLCLKKTIQASLMGFIVFSGFLGAILFQFWSVGVWDAFFKIQEKYGHHIQNPIVVWASNVWYEGKGLQTAALTLFFILLGYYCLRNRKILKPEIDIPVIVYVLLFGIFPYSLGSAVSLYRAESLLLPAVVLVRYMPKTVQVACVLVFAALYVHMAKLFFDSVLI